jgi:dienelactone hydrolase
MARTIPENVVPVPGFPPRKLRHSPAALRCLGERANRNVLSYERDSIRIRNFRKEFLIGYRRPVMRYLRSTGLLTGVFLTVFVMPVAASAAETKISFSSLDKSQTYQLSGTLYLPENAASPCPAIVLVHGTSGINQVGKLYREPVLGAGIAIFEVDFKTGIFTGPMDRPHPDSFLPMAFAALKELRKNPAIDSNHIGIMGFSLGGGITMRTAVDENRQKWMGSEKGFVAHVAFYPVSKPLVKIIEHSSGLTGAPIIIFYGTEDSYGEGKAVPELKNMLKKKFNFDVTTVEYAGATHDFNRAGRSFSYRDPAAIGGTAKIKWDPDAAHDSVTKVVAFLHENLAAK